MAVLLDTGPWVALLSCELVVAETCVLLARSGFDPALALKLPFVLQEQIEAVSTLFKRYDNVPASLVDAALIRLAEISDAPALLTIDSDFHIYRRHGRHAMQHLRR